MKLKKIQIAAAALFAGVGLMAGLAIAQAPAVPQVSQINSGDLFLDVVNGLPSAQSQYASAALLGNYGSTLPGVNASNYLIGGDSSTNLYQRGTTGSSVTTTLTYGGPDRWAYWSGANTAMTVSRTTTAADLPAAGFTSGFKMAKTAAQTGVVQMCMIQVVEGAYATSLAGQTVELSFYATAGSTFSAASSLVSMNIITGTTTDEGSAKAGFGLNAGGGGGSGWTGQVNRSGTVAISTSNGRYGFVAPIASTATEVAVALCFTPVGTAGANDYVAFSGIQLTPNNAQTATAGTTGAALVANSPTMKAFYFRPQQQETALQQRYFYKLTETAAITPVASCSALDVTHANCLIVMPTTMRIAPTGAFANGFAHPTTTAQGTLGACTTLSAATTVASTVGSTQTFLVNCAAGTIPAAGTASQLYSNNGTGTISLNSEL